MHQDDFFDFMEDDTLKSEKINMLDTCREVCSSMAETLLRMKINFHMLDMDELALAIHDVQRRTENIRKIAESEALELAKWDHNYGEK